MFSKKYKLQISDLQKTLDAQSNELENSKSIIQELNRKIEAANREKQNLIQNIYNSSDKISFYKKETEALNQILAKQKKRNKYAEARPSQCRIRVILTENTD